jgi:GNAT superfamily N-acetyltransferase
LSTSLSIRNAIPDDASTLSQLICNNARQTLAPHYSAQQLAVFLSYYSVAKVCERIEKQPVFCAQAKGQIVGTVGLDGTLVVGFYTHLDHQGQGIGQALMAHLHAHAMACGIDRLELYASPAASSFYRKIGYTLLAVEQVFYSGMPFEESHMRIDLR